jgi:hypothetical protein
VEGSPVGRAVPAVSPAKAGVQSRPCFRRNNGGHSPPYDLQRFTAESSQEYVTVFTPWNT